MTTPPLTSALPISVRRGTAAARANPLRPLPPHSESRPAAAYGSPDAVISRRTVTEWHRAGASHALSP